MEEGKAPQSCNNVLHRIQATCEVMACNLDMMADVARGKFTLNLFKVGWDAFPFLGSALYLKPITNHLVGYKDRLINRKYKN